MLICYGIMESKLYGGAVNPFTLLGLFLCSLLVTGYLLDLHTFIAQSLTVCFLAEWDVGREYGAMEVAGEDIKRGVQEVEAKGV